MRGIMKKIFYAYMMSIFMLFFSSGCGGSGTANSGEIKNDIKYVPNISVENYLVTGNNIQKFSSVPKRVLAVGMGETEMVLAFCDTERIVGVYGFNDLHDFLKPQYKDKLNQVKKLSVGEINLERVLELNPDLIVAEQCSYLPKSLLSTSFWNQRNINTYVPVSSNSPEKHIRPESIDDEIQYIKDFGIIFEKEELADRFIDNINKTLAFFDEHRQEKKQLRVMVVENFGQTIASYDKTKLAGQIVLRLGGDIPETKPIIGKEDLLREDPDILFVVCSDGSHGKSLQFFTDDPVFRNMKCMKNKSVYSIELESIYCPGIRIKDGIEIIGLAMYPELKNAYEKTDINSINPTYKEWLAYKEMADLEK